MDAAAGEAPVRYCANITVDAVASYYARQATRQDTALGLAFELPEKLPVAEADFCAMLGNLIDNALIAVRQLPQRSAG